MLGSLRRPAPIGTQPAVPWKPVVVMRLTASVARVSTTRTGLMNVGLPRPPPDAAVAVAVAVAVGVGVLRPAPAVAVAVAVDVAVGVAVLEPPAPKVKKRQLTVWPLATIETS